MDTKVSTFTKRIPIIFSIPVNKPWIAEGETEGQPVGSLGINAEIMPDGKVKYNSINWNGADIKDLLINTQEGRTMLNSISFNCKVHLEKMNPFDKWQLQVYNNILAKDTMVGGYRHILFEREQSKILNKTA